MLVRAFRRLEVFKRTSCTSSRFNSQPRYGSLIFAHTHAFTQLTMRLFLGAVLIGVVLLACTVGECTGSSLEEFYRVRAKNQLREVARHPRAASASPPSCPHHPPPIPQAFISSHVRHFLL
jgi:hypothetical protein